MSVKKNKFFSLGPLKLRSFLLALGMRASDLGENRGLKKTLSGGISEPCTMWAGQKPK